MKTIYITLFAVFLSACEPTSNSPIASAAKLAAGIESEFIVEVTGTPGLKFSGAHMTMMGNGSSNQKSVEGKTPTQYPLHGSIVSVNFQKQGTKGELIVTIKRDGKEVARSETTAAYGVVSLATQ